MNPRRLVFLLLFLPGCAYAASQRKIIGKDLPPTDTSAINNNFTNINNELRNAVHKTGNETIHGTKTFTDPIVVSSGVVVSTTPWIVQTAYGGTGKNLSLSEAGEILYFSAPGVISTLSAGTSGYVLQANGAGPVSWVLPSTYFGCFEQDSNSDLMPKTSCTDDINWELDVNSDLEPKT